MLYGAVYPMLQGCNGPIEIWALWSQAIAILCVGSMPLKSPKRSMKEQRGFVVIVLVRITLPQNQKAAMYGGNEKPRGSQNIRCLDKAMGNRMTS